MNRTRTIPPSMHVTFFFFLLVVISSRLGLFSVMDLQRFGSQRMARGTHGYSRMFSIQLIARRSADISLRESVLTFLRTSISSMHINENCLSSCFLTWISSLTGMLSQTLTH